MHRIAATPGGLNPQGEGVIFIDQTPAPIVLLTAADTDIQTLAQALQFLPPDFPAVRGVNLLHLQQQLTIDTYADQVLSQAQAIILRLLGGRGYWTYGLEVVRDLVTQTQGKLWVLPGDDRPDPDLISHSTVAWVAVDRLWQYFCEGGVDNLCHALQYIADVSLDYHYEPPGPRVVPKAGGYEFGVRSFSFGDATRTEFGVEKEFGIRSFSFADATRTEFGIQSFSFGEASPTEFGRNGFGVSPAETLRERGSELENREDKEDGRSGAVASDWPRVGVLFYRAHYLAGNLKAIDALCQALIERNLEPVPIFVSSLRDKDVQAEVLALLQPPAAPSVDLILNTTGFAIAEINQPPQPHSSSLPPHSTPKRETPNSEPQTLNPEPRSRSVSKGEPPNSEFRIPNSEFFPSLNIPILQVILSGSTVEQWQNSFQGLSPRDMAMNVALPEVDGRIITRTISFKALQIHNPALETDVVRYQPEPDRVAFVADLAANWIKLRRTPVSDRRIALILANYPTRDGRLANGVGLDTPESCVQILKALQQAGYTLNNIPENGQDLIQRLTQGITNDPESQTLRATHQTLAPAIYDRFFTSLPKPVQQAIYDRWQTLPSQTSNPRLPTPKEPQTPNSELRTPNSELQTPNSELQTPNSELRTPNSEFRTPNSELRIPNSEFPIPGLQLNNLFIGIQPSRGYDRDPTLNYHSPDLEPTHEYLAFYCWLREVFGAQAIVHVGKHGNLEWLPGKSVALSQDCYPEVALGPLPHFYPFIVNDPGEGSQAKRRSQAVILDHLTPPMTRAELYGSLLQLEQFVDEYYEAQSLDPARLPIIQERILALVKQENLQEDLGIPTQDLPLVLNTLDSYLCELKEAQIRDGLHIFGQCPQGRQLRDLILSIARSPSPGRIGLTRALAQDLQLDFDPLTANLGDPCNLDLTIAQSMIPVKELQRCRTIGDVVEHLETHATTLIDRLLTPSFRIPNSELRIPQLRTPNSELRTQKELTWIAQTLIPALQNTDREITHLLQGLDGQYVPPGPSGAPTRGRPEVLPTGCNFYSVDLRGLPTESAWEVGRKAAETFIERYTQDNGEYPHSLGLSVWGTATMRTGGDDIAEALALLGVCPVWEGSSRRVIDFEILPTSVLGRPRVDITLRISGFFRDAFPNLIDLFDQAVTAVAQLDEPSEENPLATRVRAEIQTWQQAGLTTDQAKQRATYRIFGSKPGAYGAGLQGLIEAQNWHSDEDLAQAYINWSCYAYKGERQGVSAPEAFRSRLQQMQVVLHNQDNREHDLLDSDDYYQFQGGLTVAVRTVQGQQPQTYFGDHARPDRPRIRRLSEEIARVYRSRVVNPKWIAGVMRHGYKGAFEMAATVDYLFAYDATAQCVADHMYEGVAQAYVLQPQVQAFVQQYNPWALRDMAERLLEAHQRGLWQGANQTLLDRLRMVVLETEGTIEATMV
jgi:cobaltochelatase CobN